MGTEAEKSKEEIRYLSQYFSVNGISDHSPIEKLNPTTTPDLRCLISGNIRYFEMSRMCSQDLSKHVKKRNSEAIWLDDQVERILDKKLTRKYEVSERVDLILYDIGLIALPPDVVVAKLNHAMKTRNPYPYTEIWYLAENAAHRINIER